MQKYIYGNFINFNPRVIVNNSCRKNNALQNYVFSSVFYFKQHFALAIIDAEALQSLFVNISRIFGISHRTSLFSEIHADERNLSPRPLRVLREDLDWTFS